MKENEQKIYLDHAATTPLDKDVFEAMEPYFSEIYGNPSSIHSFGQEAQSAVIEARHQVANFLNCEPEEIIFTSGATESNNTAIKGIVGSHRVGKDLPHIIVSRIEHECVLASGGRVKKNELADVTYLSVDREGLIDLAELRTKIQPNTVLVSIMYANNEIGVVQPIAQIGALVRELNENRKQKIYFHTDAVQAINYLDCDVQNLGVDLLALSAHKIYGPKGMGVLFVRKGTPLAKFMDGGEQEFKLRGGTHNTPGIVGLGAAIEKVKNEKFHPTGGHPKGEKIKSIEKLRDKLIDGVLNSISGAFLNGSRENRLSNNVNFRFEGVEGEAIVMALDLVGIAASTGSACAARSLEPSHVLLALGLNALETHSSIRFSLGRGTTEQEIDKVLDVLPGIIERLRNISGNLKGAGMVERATLPKDFGC